MSKPSTEKVMRIACLMLSASEKWGPMVRATTVREWSGRNYYVPRSLTVAARKQIFAKAQRHHHGFNVSPNASIRINGNTGHITRTRLRLCVHGICHRPTNPIRVMTTPTRAIAGTKDIVPDAMGPACVLDDRLGQYAVVTQHFQPGEQGQASPGEDPQPFTRGQALGRPSRRATR